MKFFAFFVLMMAVLIEAFALPAVPEPQPEQPGQPEALEPAPVPQQGAPAPKNKRAILYYTPYVPIVKQYYPYYYYNSYPYDIIL